MWLAASLENMLRKGEASSHMGILLVVRTPPLVVIPSHTVSEMATTNDEGEPHHRSITSSLI